MTDNTVNPATIDTADDLPDGPARRLFTSSANAAAIFALARKRQVSPEALLAVTLLEILAHTGPHVVLPRLVGGRASLNLATLSIGHPGAGKGSTDAVFRESIAIKSPGIGFSGNLATAGARVVYSPVDSGEGISAVFDRAAYDAYCAAVADTADNDGDGSKKPPTPVEPPPDRALFHSSELTKLAAQKGRAGSTALSFITMALTGDDIGTGGAARETKRSVPAMSYRACFKLSGQPGSTGWLLGEAGTGLPQRFLWVDAVDRYTPAWSYTHDVADDDELWVDDADDADDLIVIGLPAGVGERRELPPGVDGWTSPQVRAERVEVGVVKSVAHAVQADRSQVRSGVLSDDAHRNLLRLRLATALGLLDGELKITWARWERAGDLLSLSDSVRATCYTASAGVTQAEEDRKEIVRRTARENADRAAEDEVQQKIMAAAADGRTYRGRGGLRSALSRPQRNIADAMIPMLGAEGVIQVSGDGAQHLSLPPAPVDIPDPPPPAWTPKTREEYDAWVANYEPPEVCRVSDNLERERDRALALAREALGETPA